VGLVGLDLGFFLYFLFTRRRQHNVSVPMLER
jgi:hypothetical protein